MDEEWIHLQSVNNLNWFVVIIGRGNKVFE